MQDPDWIVSYDDGGLDGRDYDSGWTLYFVRDRSSDLDSVLVAARTPLLAANWFDARLGVVEIHVERVAGIDASPEALEALEIEDGAAFATPRFLKRIGATCEHTDAHRAGFPDGECDAYVVHVGGRSYLHYAF